MCGIAIEDDKKRSREMEVHHDDLKEMDEMKLMKVDREVMNVLKFVLNGEFTDEDLLPELLKMNKGKLIKSILTLNPRVVACDAKIDKLERKVEKYKSRYSNACDSLLNDNYIMICNIACLNSKIELFQSNVSCDSCVGMLAKNEKLELDYSTCLEQLEIARVEIIEINSSHSNTCSSTLKQ
jgi:ribosome-associated translation inhibitor RaiA